MSKFNFEEKTALLQFKPLGLPPNPNSERTPAKPNTAHCNQVTNYGTTRPATRQPNPVSERMMITPSTTR